MRHLKDAKNYIACGRAHKALEVLDSVLFFSPKNPEALELKSKILDSWGKFDESFFILQSLAKQNSSSEEFVEKFKNRISEDKLSLAYSKITGHGRVYYHVSYNELWMALFSLLGSLSYLHMMPFFLKGLEPFLWMTLGFVAFVLLPCVFLLSFYFFGVKKIFVGIKSLKIHHRFSKKEIKWNDIYCAQVIYDTNLNKHFLKIAFYVKGLKKPLLIDISDEKSDVKARRHFTRNVLNHVGIISYVNKKTFNQAGGKSHKKLHHSYF